MWVYFNRKEMIIVELQQKLTFAYVVALIHQQALDCGRDGRVRFEILNGLNLAVGGNQTADGAALDGGGAYFERSLVKDGIQQSQDSQQCKRGPYPTPAGRRFRIVGRCQPVCFQSAAGITVSINLPLRR